MLKALIHALAVVVLLVVTASSVAFAQSPDDRNPALTTAASYAQAVVVTRSDQQDEHAHHGDAPCPHGGCSSACVVCAFAGSAMIAPQALALRMPVQSSLVGSAATSLADLRLKLLPFRPPCALA